MSAGATAYRRLPGRAGLFLLHRAYLGDDHLLAVRTIVVREVYRRFFFRDIAAFSIHRTGRHVAWGIVFGVLFVVSGLLAWGLWPGRTGEPAVGSTISGLAAALWLVLLIVNLALGPSCTCFVRTAVQTVELPSINRLRRAMRAREMILERVRAAQRDAAVPGAIEGDATAGAAVEGAMPPPARISPAVPGWPVPAGMKALAGRALGATSLAAIAAAGGVSYDFIETSVLAFAVNLLLVFLAMAAAVTQLILGRDGRLSRPAMAVAWAVPAVMVLGVVAAYVALIAAIASDPGSVSPEDRLDPFSLVTALPPGSNAVVDGCYLTIAALYLLVGLAGAAAWTGLGAGGDPERPAPPPP